MSASTLISSRLNTGAHACSPSDVSARMTHVSPNSGSLASSPACLRLLNLVKYIWYEPFSDTTGSSVGLWKPPSTHHGHGETGVHVSHARDQCNNTQNHRCRQFVSEDKSRFLRL